MGPQMSRGAPGMAARAPEAILKNSIFFIFYDFFHLGPLDPYKPPFNPINRPWDPARSIELDEIYIFVDLELHSAYLIAIHAKTMKT